jgi:hypothetical protein
MSAGKQWGALWLVCLVVLSTAAFARQSDGAKTERPTLTQPLLCWWRTSTGAVRIGEVFSIVLTCALVETPDVTVVAKTEELEPSAIRLQPFEITGGARRQDLVTNEQRFIQYEYRARLISENQFGKDASLPELKITYSVRQRVEANPRSLEGREQTYRLTPMTIRVLSLVPANAVDIRDATRHTFEDVERERSLAGVWRILSVVFLAFAALPVLFAGVRLRERRRSGGAAQTRVAVDDVAILRQAGRELATIARARDETGWSDDLILRLTTTLRIISAYALGLPVRQLPSTMATEATAGQLTVRRGWRRTPVIVPAWVTPLRVAEERARRSSGTRTFDDLEELESMLTRVTEARYGRAPGAADAVFDETLTVATRVLRGLKIENLWLVKQVRAAAKLTAPSGWRA